MGLAEDLASAARAFERAGQGHDASLSQLLLAVRAGADARVQLEVHKAAVATVVTAAAEYGALGALDEARKIAHP